MLFVKSFLEALKPMKLQGSTGSYRKKQNLLADYDRSDPNYPQELTRLKKLHKGSFNLRPNSASKILKLFKITDLTDSNPRNLGNTGITISVSNGNYTITKQ
tara:strand:- start:421 stop:726 length:306 start_codon:yes stop_codon:yes gene_type:complete